jgi:hypothetical protein
MKNTIITLLIILFASCSKDDKTSEPQDKLPEATQIGANTAGCYINGELLVPKNGSQAIGGSPVYGLNYRYGNNFYPDKNDYWQLEIANKKDLNSAGIILWIKNMQAGNGDYIIGQSNGQLYGDGTNDNQIIAGIKKNGLNKTYYSSANSGILKITRSDLSVGISTYSGTFYCKLYNKDNPNETIEITDGRFDINSLTLNK